MTTRADSPTPENALAERAAGYWLLGAAMVVLSPHVLRFPLWLSLVLAALFGWRFFVLRRGWPVPNRWVRYGLTLLLVVLLYRQFGTLFGRDPGSALLAAMLALKFLELQRLRDYVLAVLLVYFLIFIGFLYGQEPWRVLLLLAVFVLSSATLVRLAVPGARPRLALRVAGMLLLQALPLMIVMHLLFPRLPGSLWGLPQDAHAGLSGLSDDMQPGSIQDLTLSGEVVFRAHFDGPVPPAGERYWRAVVMTHTDGRRWTRGALQSGVLSFESGAPPYSYSLALEPSSKPWIPTLELTATQPKAARLLPGFVLEARQPLRERLRIDLVAHTRYRITHLNDAERLASLRLPDRRSRRVEALAQEWRRTASDDAGLVNIALRYFREQEFFYTLQPPLLGDDPVDEFLFETRRGFCEHYTAAFVTLMRTAGIPARVITGYQGGEVNPAGNYLLVRQSDAHAWAEVWLGPRGWVRVDPTAAVAPERIDYGAEGLRRLFARGLQPGNLPNDALRELLALGWFDQARQQLRLSWDAIQSAWQSWVLGYDMARQRALLARLGLQDARPGRLLGLLALAVAVIFALYILANRPRRMRADATQRAYLDFCRKLARIGLVRLPQEGPLDYSSRASRQRPDLAAGIHAITALYLDLRYGGLGDAAQIEQLRQQVASFRPTRS